MRLVIQRVSEASVSIGGTLKSSIGEGMMILVGVCDEDTDEDIEYLCQKVVKLRIFDDSEGVMNLPVTEVPGWLSCSHSSAMKYRPAPSAPTCRCR